MKMLDTVTMIRAGIDFVSGQGRVDPDTSGSFTSSTNASHYPEGLISMHVSGLEGWPGHGNVLTYKEGNTFTQIWIAKAGNTMRYRGANASGVPLDWHNPIPTGWTSATLVNGFTPYTGTASYQGGAFYKMDRSGTVRLKGMLYLGTNGAIAFTLPVGYRPLQSHIFPLYGSSGFVEARLTSAGDFSIYVSGTIVTNHWVAFESVTFPAEQ